MPWLLGPEGWTFRLSAPNAVLKIPVVGTHSNRGEPMVAIAVRIAIAV